MVDEGRSKRRCLNSLLTSSVRTTNGTPIMVLAGMRLLLFLVGRYITRLSRL